MQLAQRQPDGDTLRGYLQWQASASGKADPRLTSRPPAGCEFLWTTYCELSAMRPSGMGMSAIPGAEYEAWQRMNGITLNAWEVDTLKAMDAAARSAAAESQQQSRTAK
jgi:hypothetical protein